MSGFCALSLEIVWFRLVDVAVRSKAQTFGTVLCVYLLGSALGLYPVLLAWRRRAPKALLARMILNLAADAAGGAIPILGDIWDFLFRAHARNAELLRARADVVEFRLSPTSD